MQKNFTIVLALYGADNQYLGTKTFNTKHATPKDRLVSIKGLVSMLSRQMELTGVVVLSCEPTVGTKTTSPYDIGSLIHHLVFNGVAGPALELATLLQGLQQGNTAFKTPTPDQLLHARQSYGDRQQRIEDACRKHFGKECVIRPAQQYKTEDPFDFITSLLQDQSLNDILFGGESSKALLNMAGRPHN